MTDWMGLDRAYSLYFWYMPLLGRVDNQRFMETPFDGHGGEAETSLALHLFPDRETDAAPGWSPLRRHARQMASP